MIKSFLIDNNKVDEYFAHENNKDTNKIKLIYILQNIFNNYLTHPLKY